MDARRLTKFISYDFLIRSVAQVLDLLAPSRVTGVCSPKDLVVAKNRRASVSRLDAWNVQFARIEILGLVL